jgi:formylglycine-generating enzyme required for sulfatase activity
MVDHENMVRIVDFPGGPFWIDAFEASVGTIGVIGSGNQDQDGDGKIADEEVAAVHAATHGFVYDDDGGEEGVERTTSTAQPAAFALPWTTISFYQAAAVCTRSGKRLCIDAEWIWACQNGPRFSTYPYGADYDGGDEAGVDCWTNTLMTGRQLTGSASACHTETGIYDLSGNATEWTSQTSISAATGRGGFYANIGTAATCLSVEVRAPAEQYSANTGFRCCSTE